MRTLLLALAILALTGCVKRPDGIWDLDVDPVRWDAAMRALGGFNPDVQHGPGVPQFYQRPPYLPTPVEIVPQRPVYQPVRCTRTMYGGVNCY